jgi:hypothetical protein
VFNQLLSNRVEKTPATEVSADRYEYLALSEAEPDLGVPVGNSYILASTTTGTRSWVNPATNLTAPGSNTQVVFNNSGVLSGAASLVYDTATGRVGIGVASPTSRLDIAETWNNAGTAFTLIKADITDTSSNASSKIFDFKLNGNNRLNLAKDAVLSIDGTDLGQSGGALRIVASDRSVTLRAAADGGNNVGLGGPSFYTTSRDGATARLIALNANGTVNYFRLESDNVADTLVLRRTTNAQTFRIYNTFTDASNYERAVVGWNTNVLEIGTEAAGTGTQRNITIKGGSTTQITGGTVSVPNGGVTLGASAFFFAWNGRSRIGSSSDGIISISNAAGTDFNRLQIGGTTSSFPALKRNTTVLEVKLADDSAFTALRARELNTENASQTSESTTLATTSKTQVASFPVADFRSGKLIVQSYDTVTGEVQISELLVAHNGTTATATEYGVVHTGSSAIVTYDVDISGGNVRLMATRTSANSTQYKVSETLMVA